MSRAPTRAWSTSGTGSCQRSASAGNVVAEVAGARPHVAMGELEPGLGGRRSSNSPGVVQEAARRSRGYAPVFLERQVRGQHDRRVPQGPRRGRRARCSRRARPSGSTGSRRRGFGSAPTRRRRGSAGTSSSSSWARGPGALQAAGDGVLRVALAALVGPAEALLLDPGGRRLRAHAVGGLVRAVDLAEGVAARSGDGLLVVHGHAAEGLSNLHRGRERIRVPAGPSGFT